VIGGRSVVTWLRSLRPSLVGYRCIPTPSTLSSPARRHAHVGRGGFAAAGITNDTGLGFADTANMAVAKFAAANDASPHRVWTRTWDNPIQHLADKANAVCTDLTGGIIAAGYSMHAPVGMDWAVVKWNDAGQFQWSHEFVAVQSGGVAIAYDVTVDGAGNVYVCGTTQTGSGEYKLVLRKLSGTNGQTIWETDYQGLAGTYTAGVKVVLDNHLNSYVVGTGTPASGDADMILVKFNAAGQRLWTEFIDSGKHKADQGVDVAIQGDSVYVLGGMAIDVGKRMAAVVRMTTGGTRKWVRTWQESSATAAYPQALTVDSHGNAVVAGYSTLLGSKSYAFLVKWTKGGTRSWAKVSYSQIKVRQLHRHRVASRQTVLPSRVGGPTRETQAHCRIRTGARRLHRLCRGAAGRQHAGQNARGSPR
jgi:hypothetical protein